MRTKICLPRAEAAWNELISTRPIPVEYEGLRMGSLPEYFWEDPEIKIDVYRACPEHKTRLNDELECSKGHKCKRWIRLPRRLGEGLEWSAAEPKT